MNEQHRNQQTTNEEHNISTKGEGQKASAEGKEERITLKELLLVVAVIVILVIVIVLSVRNAQKKTYEQQALNEMEIMNTMLELYAKDHERKYPISENYQELISNIGKDYGDPPEDPAKTWEYRAESSGREYTLEAIGPKGSTINCKPQKCKRVEEE